MEVSASSVRIGLWSFHKVTLVCTLTSQSAELVPDSGQYPNISGHLPESYVAYRVWGVE